MKQFVTLTTSIDTLTGTSSNDTFVSYDTYTAAGVQVPQSGSTLTTSDTINGGLGVDTLSITVDGILDGGATAGGDAVNLAVPSVTGIEVLSIRDTASSTAGADIITVNAANFAGLTSFVADRSTGAMAVTGLANGATIGMVGNGSVTNGDVGVGYAATVTAGVINISGGTKAGAITETGAGITSNTINSTGAANVVGVVTVSGTIDKTLAINAATALTVTSIGGFTAGATITASGAATSATTGLGLTLGALDANVTKLDATGLTAGGVSATMNADTTLVITGGAGNDRITTGSVLTTGSVAAGTGTADRLTIANNNHIATLALGNKYSGFEVVELAAGITQNYDLLVTNNTLTGERFVGSATVTNVNAATAANTTVLANATLDIGVKGALTPGQIDTVGITVTDEVATTVSTITLTAPTLTGVEVLNLVATDNATISTLANALSLTNLNISGAGDVVITALGTVPLQSNYAINAGTATGNLTIGGTGATTNGFSVVGSSGINLITGGSQVFSANLAASAAKADVITLTNATGGTLALANATITGFTNSATVSIGDKLDIAGTIVVGKAATAVAAVATATLATMTEAISTTGIITFAGTGAATATLADKINAAMETTFLGNATLQTGAFEHAGNTYIVTTDGTAGYSADADYVVQLTGVTGVTALSTTASGATTVFVV